MTGEAPALAAIGTPRHHYVAFVLMLALAIAAPFGIYPVFLAKLLCIFGGVLFGNGL